MKKNNILVLSFLISFFFSTATLLIIFIIEENIKNFFTLFFLTFTTYHITLYFSFKLFLSKTIKKLIDEFYSSEYNLSDQSNLDNLDSLSKSLKEYAKNKNLQIELLKDQDNYRKDFIGNISHELKTPLFTIQSYILTLIDGGMDDPDILKKYLKRSSKAIDRLTYLVKDLDLISQFESGVKNIEKEKFDKNPVLDRFVHQLKSCGLQVRYTIKPDFSWACTNIDKIKNDYKLKDYILLFPFCSEHLSIKKWPYYNELIELIKKKFQDKYKIVVAPGPSELKDARNINAISILDNGNILDISQLSSLIKESSFVIANDTGPAHMAAHLNVKGLSLFGKHTTAYKVSIERENFKPIQVEDLNKLSQQKVFEKILNILV